MKKILLFLISISSLLSSDDLKIADEFKDGDVVSADTFNQIFETIERINRKITPEDVLGTWTCNSVYLSYSSSFPSEWQNIEDIASELIGSQINFQLTSIGTNPGDAGIITTSSPAPLFIELGNTALNGSWILRNNNLFISSQNNNKRMFSINFVSPSRFIINDNDYSVTCDLAAAVPSIPLNASAINSSGSISLSWTDSSNNEDGFKIYRKISSDSEYTLLATQSTVGYLDTSAENGISYNYYIVSYNANGESAKSKIILITSDSIMPRVISTSPENGASLTFENNFTAEDGSLNIFFNFSENVFIYPDQNQVGFPLRLFVNDIEVLTGAFSFVALQNVLALNQYSFPLNRNGQGDYKIVLERNFVKDINGNLMEENYVLNFSVSE
tara:strand:+ start:233 stop:1393 length:1161 start_codon:yes stop_codon:yes gene_type:complete